MATTKRTWLWVILGVFGTLALLVVVLIGGAIFEFRQHVKNAVVDTVAAEQEFARQRDRFKGQEPLIEFAGNDEGNDNTTVHRAPANAARAQVSALRVLIYDRMQNRLIHVEIPGWVLRMMPTGRYAGFQGNEQFARHRITIEDIERHGLGLVLDGDNRNTRILVWSE